MPGDMGNSGEFEPDDGSIKAGGCRWDGVTLTESRADKAVAPRDPEVGNGERPSSSEGDSTAWSAASMAGSSSSGGGGSGNSISDVVKLMTDKSMSYESLQTRAEYLHVFAAVAGVIGLLIVLVSSIQTMSLGGSAVIAGLVFLVGGGVVVAAYTMLFQMVAGIARVLTDIERNTRRESDSGNE